MLVMPRGPLVIDSTWAKRRATSVSVSVTIAKYTPRKRKMGRPISTLAPAQKSPASGNVHQNSTPYFTTKIADT